jgi:hypothetical protein
MKATQARATPTTVVYKCSVCERPIVAFYARHGYDAGTCSKKCDQEYKKLYVNMQFGPKEAV